MRNALDLLEEHYGLASALRLLRSKEVPSWWGTWIHYLGGLAVFLLVLQVLSGFFLLLYYMPNARDAHGSVAAIMTEMPLGWVIRSFHHHTAQAMILTVMLHGLTVLLSKAFRGDRAPTYLAGLTLLSLTLFMGFSGRLLPWDALSIAATAVGTGLPADVPLVGPAIRDLLRGGVALSPVTLSRFFALHISLVPASLGLVLGFHLLLVQKKDIHCPVQTSRRPIPFFPDFLLRQGRIWLWAFAVLVTCAILHHAELLAEGDPLAPAPKGIRPEWYFLAFYEILKLSGDWTFLSSLSGGITGELLSILLLGTVGALLVFLPLLDRRGRGLGWMGFVVAVAAGLAVLTVIGATAPKPEIPAAAGVAEKVAILRSRTTGYLFPFWLSVLALSWWLGSAIRLCDQITASEMPGVLTKREQ